MLMWIIHAILIAVVDVFIVLLLPFMLELGYQNGLVHNVPPPPTALLQSFPPFHRRDRKRMLPPVATQHLFRWTPCHSARRLPWHLHLWSLRRRKQSLLRRGFPCGPIGDLCPAFSFFFGAQVVAVAFAVALVVSVFVESAFALHVLAAFDAVATFAVTAADSTAVPQTLYLEV